MIKINKLTSHEVKGVFEKIPLKNYIYLAMAINTLTLVFIFLAKNLLPPEVPLFYGNALGEAQLVKTLSLTIAPGASILILFINIFLSNIIEEVFLKKILIISSFFVSILSSITIFRIILLVGFF